MITQPPAIIPLETSEAAPSRLASLFMRLVTRSASETRQFGCRLGERLIPGDVICLSGDLGAGKTTLTQGIAAGWGALDAVSSPTFVLVNEYARADGARLWHLDCYRLTTGAEALALGLDDLLDAAQGTPGGALVIEWPEHILEALPADRLTVRLASTDLDTRLVTLEPRGDRPTALARLLAGEASRA